MAERIPLLDRLTWDHPLVKTAQVAAINKIVDSILPGPSSPPPELVAINRMQQTLEKMAKSPKVTQESATSGHSVTHESPSPTLPFSAYLAQVGAEGVDTGCLPCGRAHLGATQAGLERAADIARERGMDDPEVRARVATVAEELDALLDYDWTPERIAKSPPEHRAALDRYTPEVKSLYGIVTPPGPAGSLRTVSKDLKEALRFAREDGVGHSEAQARISRAEATIDDLERYQLAPERVDELPPEEAAWWEDNLKNIRRLRQSLHNDAKTPEKLHEVAAGFGRLTTEAYAPWLRRQDPDKLTSLAQYASDLRLRFKAETDNL